MKALSVKSESFMLFAGDDSWLVSRGCFVFSLTRVDAHAYFLHFKNIHDYV